MRLAVATDVGAARGIGVRAVRVTAIEIAEIGTGTGMKKVIGEAKGGFEFIRWRCCRLCYVP